MILPRLLATAMLVLIGGTAMAQTPPNAGKPAEIPFVQFGQIDDFEADGDHGVYLETIGRKWYYATIMGPCTQLPWATRIGVKTRGTDSLDKFGELLVDGETCHIDQLTASGPPPKKTKHGH